MEKTAGLSGFQRQHGGIQLSMSSGLCHNLTRLGGQDEGRVDCSRGEISSSMSRADCEELLALALSIISRYRGGTMHSVTGENVFPGDGSHHHSHKLLSEGIAVNSMSGNSADCSEIGRGHDVASFACATSLQLTHVAHYLQLTHVAHYLHDNQFFNTYAKEEAWLPEWRASLSEYVVAAREF